MRTRLLVALAFLLMLLFVQSLPWDRKELRITYAEPPMTLEDMTSEDCVLLADDIMSEYALMRPSSMNQLETLRNVVMAKCEDYKAKD